MSIIKQYQNRYDRINNNILRPIEFKNSQEMYDFLFDFIDNKHNIYYKKFTLTSYNDSAVQFPRQERILKISLDYYGHPFIHTSALCQYRLCLEYDRVYCYVNYNKDMFVFRANYREFRYTFILKEML